MFEVRRLAHAGLAVVALVFGFASAAGRAEAGEKSDFKPSYNDFGGTGLLQMPNARMAPDGDLALGASYVWPYTRYFFTSQFLPWLQGTFRYTDISNQDYGFNNGQSYKDKGVDVKLRLFPEGEYNPELAVGLRDIGGTGLFSSEYVVLSRRIYDFDLTLGMAWGNAGTRADMENPIGYFFPSMSNRQRVQGTGNLTGSYFTGPSVSIIGGVEYHTPIEGLRLKLELDGNSYQEEPKLNKFDTASRFNFGAEYAVADWLDLNLSIERGNEAMMRFVLHSNLNTDKGVPKLDDRPPMPVKPRTQAAPAQNAGGAQVGGQIVQLLQEHHLRGESVDVRDDVATVRLRDPLTPEAATGLIEDFNRLPNRPGRLRLLDGEGKPVASAMPHSAAETAAEAKAIFNGLAFHDIQGLRYFVEDQTATLVFSQSTYIRTSMAFGRAARVVANHAPAWVEAIHMVSMNDNLPYEEITILRRDVESAANGTGSADETWLNATVTAPEEPDHRDGEYAADRGIGYGFTVLPHTRQSIGGPDAFLLYQIYAQPVLTVTPLPGLELATSAGVNLTNNFNDFNYMAPSSLPRVRTRIRDYMKSGDVWLESLYANYTHALAPNWYGAVAGGMFEQMYGGVAGEVLYRAPNARWALGVDVAHVRQRMPGDTFGFDSYQTTTGNVSYYQMTPFEDVYFVVSAGRYLAHDVGATFQVGRRFDSGVELGVWATKTNVSAAEFGEGSFDKGIYVSVPMELFYTNYSRNRATFPFSPLIRDGGQKAVIPTNLFGRTGGFDETATHGGWRDTWR